MLLCYLCACDDRFIVFDIKKSDDQFHCAEDQFEAGDGKADAADNKFNRGRSELSDTNRIVFEGKKQEEKTYNKKYCTSHKKDQSRILFVSIDCDVVMCILMKFMNIFDSHLTAILILSAEVTDFLIFSDGLPAIDTMLFHF